MRFDITYLLQMPISIFNALIVAIFFSGFLVRKYGSKTLYLTAYVGYFILNFVTAAFIPELIIGLTILVCISYPFFLYSGTTAQKLICGGLLIAYSFVSECSTMVAISYFLDYTIEEIRLDMTAFYLGAYVSVILLLSFAFMVVKRRNARLSPLPNNYYIVLLIIVFICTGLSYNDILKLEQSGNPASIEYLLSAVAVAVLSVLVFIVFESYQKHAEQKEHTALLEKQLWQEEQRFKLIDEQNREIVAIKHDILNHLTSIHKLLSDEQQDEAKEYIDEYFSQASSVLTKSITGKPSVDVLISEKVSVAERSGITFSIEASKLSTINISPYHMNIILSNAIDNAIEACSRLPEDVNRYISLGIKTEGNNLYIRIKNPSLMLEFYSDGLPISSKNDKTYHGLGLSTIKRVAESYGGTILCTYKSNEFTLYVQLINHSPAQAK